MENIAAYPTQSNTRYGSFPVLAGETLTSMEGRVVTLKNDAGTLKAYLPDAVTDTNLFLLVEGAASGSLVTVMPLVGVRNVRLRLQGTCNPGDHLVLATINATDDGKVAANAGTGDVGTRVAIAEETGADEQLVLCRPAYQEHYIPVGKTIQVALWFLALALGALFLAPVAQATNLTLMIRDGTGTSLTKEITASDVGLLPGNLSVGGGNIYLDKNGDLEVLDTVTAGDLVIDEATGVISFTGATSATISTGTANLTFAPAGGLTSVTGALNVSTDLDVVDTVTAGDIVVDEATGVISFTGATSATISTGTSNITIAPAGGLTSITGDAAVSGGLTVTGNITAGGFVGSASKSFVVGDMTDNTNTTGYIDFAAGAVPAGAVVLGWKAVTATGFTGDTTAVIQVGIAGGVGNFSTTTNGSCVAAGTVGSASVLASSFCAAATTPRVTITGGADFTSISAGNCTVTVYYAY